MSGDQPCMNETHCSVADACNIACVSDGYMRRMIRDGKVSALQISGVYLVDKASLSKFRRQPGFGRPAQLGVREFYEGRIVDFGEYWAHVERPFSGSAVGVSLNRVGSGVMNHDECHRLGWFLLEASEWLKCQPDPDGMPDGCVVYVIGDGCSHHKVGKAVNVRKRIKELQTGNPKKLRLSGFLPCPDERVAMRVESLSHEALNDFRSVGEWFECDSTTAFRAVVESGRKEGVFGPFTSFGTGAGNGR